MSAQIPKMTKISTSNLIVIERLKDKYLFNLNLLKETVDKFTSMIHQGYGIMSLISIDASLPKVGKAIRILYPPCHQ